MKTIKTGILYLAAILTGTGCMGGTTDKKTDSDWRKQRLQMVETQIVRRGIKDSLVLEAMKSAPRHLFVPEKIRDESYRDGPLPIGSDQTISQPYIVAIMTELLQVDSSSRVLEIGTGSGYQAAVLAEIVDSVYTIEIIPTLAERAGSILDSLKYDNISVRAGDGYSGWPEAAPFDGIIVTAAVPRLPEPLIEQLKPQGRMVVPVGDYGQDLMVVTKTDSGVVRKSIIPVRFVPMTGEIRK